MSSEYLQVAFMAGESLSEADIEEVFNNGMDTGGLDFSGANLSDDQPYFIADLLSSNKLISIVHLDLSHTVMQVDGFEAILFAATEVKSLESFVAKSLRLPKEAGMSLSKLLSSRGCLKVLDVSGNNLGDVGVSNLSGAFSIDHSKTLPKQLLSVVTITVLDLSGNDIGDTGALALCRGLSQFARRASAVGVAPFLKVLRLNDNNIGDKAAICLAQLINQRDSQAGSSATDGGGLSPVPRGGINATLQLEELALDNNPLSPRGVCALLGCAREGVFSPLKRLFLANASINADVLELLAENLRYSGNSPLQYLNLSFSIQGVLQEILGQGAPSTKNDNSAAAGGNPLRGLCSALRVLALALVQYTAARANNSALHIELGALHSTLFNYASHLQDSAEPVPDSEKQVQEIVCTLEALNRPELASVLSLQMVPNVAQWIRSAEYVFDEHSAAYKAATNMPPPRPAVARSDAAEEARSRDDSTRLPAAPPPAPEPAAVKAAPRPPPAIATPVKSSFMDNFKSNLLDSNKQHNMSGILGHSAPAEVSRVPSSAAVPVAGDSAPASTITAPTALAPSGTGHTSAATSSDNLSLQDTSASTSAMTSASNSFKISTTAAQTLQNSTREVSEQKGFLNSLAFTLSSAEQEFRSLIRGAPTTVPLPTSAAAPAPSATSATATSTVSVQGTSAQSNGPQVLEGQYRKLRDDQTTAFHDLSSEIDMLAHLSPNTKASTLQAAQSSRNSRNSGESAAQMPLPVATDGLPVPSPSPSPANFSVSSSAAGTGASAENKAEPSLVQIIGYMQSQIASMAQKQHLYETSFINKFSNLEYRIEAMEAALRLNNETLLAMQVGGNKAVRETVSAHSTVSTSTNGGPVQANLAAPAPPLQPQEVQKKSQDPPAAQQASAQSSALVKSSLAVSEVPPNEQGNRYRNTGSPSTSALNQSYKSPDGKNKSTSNSKSPAIANELLITDLLARLEVVEGRMLQDRASALQSALNRQLHQERLQQRHDLLEILVENQQLASNGNSPMNRRSPLGAQGPVPGGEFSFGPIMTMSPYGLQATSAVPQVHYSPYGSPPQQVPMPGVPAHLAPIGSQQGYSPYNYSYDPMRPHFYPLGPQHQSFESPQHPLAYLPYPPALNPYVPHDPNSHPHQRSSPPSADPHLLQQAPQAVSPQSAQPNHSQPFEQQDTQSRAPQYDPQYTTRWEDELPAKQPRTDRPSPKREREPEPPLEPFQFNFNSNDDRGGSRNNPFLPPRSRFEAESAISENSARDSWQPRPSQPVRFPEGGPKGDQFTSDPRLRQSVPAAASNSARSSSRREEPVRDSSTNVATYQERPPPVPPTQQGQQVTEPPTFSSRSTALQVASQHPAPAQLQERDSRQHQSQPQRTHPPHSSQSNANVSRPSTGAPPAPALAPAAAAAPSGAPRPRPTQESPYHDSGYYNYQFDTPLVRQPADDQSVQSHASSASNNSWRHQPAGVTEQCQRTGSGGPSGGSTDYRRLISQQNNNAHPMNHSINYSIINDISRNSLSMADDTLNDSVSLLNTRDGREINNNVPRVADRSHPTQQQPQSHTTGHNSAADSAGRGRSKTPNFMRPTTANAFKAATVRPTSTTR